jgi:hypothetical protein
VWNEGETVFNFIHWIFNCYVSFIGGENSLNL